MQSGRPVCALLDAGRREVSSALFGADGQRIREDRIGPPEEVLPDVTEPTLFCGEGLAAHADVIREQLGDKAVIAGHSPAGRLWALAQLGQQRLEAGDSDDVAALQPYYLRMPTIGGPKRRDRVRQG